MATFRCITAALLLLSCTAHAMIEHPVEWTDMSTYDVDRALRLQFGSRSNLLSPRASKDAYGVALGDQLSRVSDEFRVPPALRSSVGFWIKVYTEYTTRHIVLYDRDHPEVIYEVLDLRELDRAASRRRVRTAIAGYTSAFKALIAKNGKRPKSSYEKRILAALKKTSHRHPLTEFAANFRAQTGQRDSVMKGMLAAEAYFPRMEEIFSAMGVPPELTRLSLVESSFDHNAVSKVGATGVWQFMHKSALEFMRIDARRKLDERLSPLKSTIAAARLLRRNRQVLGNWTLAVTSYNHGLKGLVGLSKQLRTRKGMERVFSLCSNASPLGYASRNYYSEFLALLHAEAYHDLFFGEMPAAPVAPFSFRKLAKSERLVTIALESGVSLHELQRLNPDIQDPRRALPKGYWLVLPEGSRKSTSLKETLAEFGAAGAPT